MVVKLLAAIPARAHTTMLETLPQPYASLLFDVISQTMVSCSGLRI